MENKVNRVYPLSDESETPLYIQLMNFMKKDIVSGVLNVGDLLPAESELCETYKLSRTTVRQALDILAREQLIIRRRGRGSYVANPKLSRRLNHLYSFSEDMKTIGLKPSSEILETSLITADESIQETLKLPQTNITVLKLVRLRKANEEPLLFETSFIPSYLCPGIEDLDFGISSLYSILRGKYELKLYRALETLEAVKINKQTASLLECKVSSAGFKIERVAYLKSEIPFELTRSITRSDRCRFQVELFANNTVNFSRDVQ